MPKVRQSGYAINIRRYPEDDFGRILGSAIAPYSITPDRLRVTKVADLATDLGVISAGTLIGGTLGKGRVLLGDMVGGGVWRDAEERTTASITVDGAARFGLPNTPGVTMTAGLVAIHGGGIVAHTVTADKLILPGSVSSALLTSDMLLIGLGTWGVDFSGFIASSGVVGGFNEQVASWEIDRVDGSIKSYAVGKTLEDYVSTAGGVVTFSSTESLQGGFVIGGAPAVIPATTMDLRRYVTVLDDNGEPAGSEIYHTYIDGVLNGVLVRGDRPANFPYLSLVNSDLESGAYLGEGLLRLRKRASDGSANAWLTAQAVPEADIAGEDAGRVELRGLGAVRAYWGGDTIAGVPADAKPYISPSALGLRVAGGGIEFQPCYDSTGVPWYPGAASPGGTAQPTGFYLGPDIYGGGELYYHDAMTGKWYTLDKTEVA